MDFGEEDLMEDMLEEGEIGTNLIPSMLTDQDDTKLWFGSGSADTKSEPTCSLNTNLITNLVQSLQTGPNKNIVGGIIKVILEQLSKPDPNLEDISQILKTSKLLCTQTITISSLEGDASHWTAFCSALSKDIAELTKLCKPKKFDPTMNEKFNKWEDEFAKLVDLEKKELSSRSQFIKLRKDRDRLILDLYRKCGVSIEPNGGIAREIKCREGLLGKAIMELKMAESEREEVSKRCDQIREKVVCGDPRRLAKEITANDIHRCLCVALKGLMEKLEESI